MPDPLTHRAAVRLRSVHASAAERHRLAKAAAQEAQEAATAARKAVDHDAPLSALRDALRAAADREADAILADRAMRYVEQTSRAKR